MRNFLFTIVMMFNISAIAQITFEQGYIVDNDHKKTACLIKYAEWNNNPEAFEYKLSPDGEIKTGTLKNISSFGIGKIRKYIRKTVNLEVSSTNLRNLDRSGEPNFEEVSAFLEVLVEGDINLYSYKGKVTNFFLETNNELETLVYKQYLNSENDINTNNQFRQQIFNILKCPGILASEVSAIEYKKRDLVQIIKESNACQNKDYVVYKRNRDQDNINLNLRPRLNFNSLEYTQLSDETTTTFEDKTSFGFGVELEYLLPINKNKWAVAIEPTYQYYNAEASKQSESTSGGILVTKIDYSSIEIPVSLRHYFYLNQNAKIFLNASYIIDVNLKSDVVFERANGTEIRSLEFTSNYNPAFGLGYKQNDKISLEFRYHLKRELFGNYTNYDSNYGNFSLILGYTLF